MIVKIDNSLVTLTGNPTLERNVKEELDTGKIVIVSTRSFRYEMYSKIDITTPYGTEEQYLIQADNPIKLNGTEYQHNLTLIENMAFFNGVFPADRSFKVIGQTLGDILTVYKRELEAYHNVIITWSTIPQSVLDEVIPYKEFSGLSLSSILLSLFRKLWAIPKVNRVNGDWDIYPQYINGKNNLIGSDSITSMYQQNNVDYATKIKSQLKNAVNEQTEAIWFPSANGYVLPRSSSLEITSSKLRYELDSKIVAVLVVEIVDVDYYISYVNNDPEDYFTNQVIDITNQVVQTEVWDLLKTVVSNDTLVIAESNNTKNNVRYKPNNYFLTNLFGASSEGIVFKFDTSYLLNAIRRSLSNLVGLPQSVAVVILTNPLSTKDVKLRIKYVKQRDIDIVHSRKTKGNMNEITTIHQQRDSSIEINEYKKNLKLYSNRMGNNTYSKTKIFEYPDAPHKLFDYLDEKIIVTRVQNTFHNTYTYCEYEESDNFSNIEAEYALMRRSDPYTITTKSVTTNLVIQESLEFSTQARPLETRLLTDARRLLTGLFESTTLGIDKISVGVFKPLVNGWNDSYAIHMPVEPSGDGNLITLHVQFPHQTIAGKTYYDLDTDTYEDYLNPLPYTDANGALTNFELYFTKDILIQDNGEYPLILNETLYLGGALTGSGNIEPIDLDNAASLAITFEINITADENIYVGSALASESYFIKDQATTTPVVIYSSTKPYGQYDQAERVGDTDITAIVAYNYSFVNRTITITPTIELDYFSIVKDGKLLLAVNRNIKAGETYIININHISTNVSITSFEVFISSSAYSDITIFARVNQVLNASMLTTATSEIESYTRVNQAIAVDMLATVTSEIEHTFILNQVLVADMLATATSEIGYITSKDIVKAIDILTISSSEISYYQDKTKSLNAAFETTATSEIIYTATLNPSPVEWVEIETGTVTGGECVVLADLGNIKELETHTCTFIQDGDIYENPFDKTSSAPFCQDFASYTICFPLEGVWHCQDYVGQEGTILKLNECKLK